MPSLNQIPTAVMMLVMAGLIFGAGLLALDKFDDSLTAGSEAALATANVTEGIGNFAEQFPTIGTILGVSALIIVVVGAFAFGSRFTGSGMGR